jgi:hypothetical protein
MRLDEIESVNPDVQKLAALSQFLLARAQDTNSKKTISIKTFLGLAQAQGISLTGDRLRELSKQAPLNNLIADVQGDDQTGQVIFKGEEIAPTDMSVDQARATVDRMAKRATNKRL